MPGCRDFDYSHIYVAACGRKFESYARGQEHEDECQECIAALNQTLYGEDDEEDFYEDEEKEKL